MVGGLSSIEYQPPPLGLSPSQLPLKGTLYYYLQRLVDVFRNIYIYTCSDKGDRKAPQRAIAHDRKYTQDILTIASHIY